MHENRDKTEVWLSGLQRKQHGIVYDQKLLKEAVDYCKKKHDEWSGDSAKYRQDNFFQKREKRINTLFNMAEKLVDWGADSETVAAAFLSDAIHDCGVTEEQIQSRFGENIRFLLADYEQIRRTTIGVLKGNVDRKTISYKVAPGTVLMGAARRIEDFKDFDCLNREKQIGLLENTKTDLVELLKQHEAFGAADELEELCFRYAEQAKFRAVKKGYNELFGIHHMAAEDGRNRIESCCGKESNVPSSLNAVQRVVCEKRKLFNLYDHLFSMIKEEEKTDTMPEEELLNRVRQMITLHNVPFYDVTMIVKRGVLHSLNLSDKKDYFFEFFKKWLEKQPLGFALVEAGYVAGSDRVPFFIVRDMYGLRYRFFVRTVEEYRKYFAGNAADPDLAYTALQDQDSFYRQDQRMNLIDVSDATGKVHKISKGSTILDFTLCAFSRETALRAEFFKINGEKTEKLPQTQLYDGDRVEVTFANDYTVSLEWFKYVHNEYSKDVLIGYFKDKMK